MLNRELVEYCQSKRWGLADDLIYLETVLQEIPECYGVKEEELIGAIPTVDELQDRKNLFVYSSWLKYKVLVEGIVGTLNLENYYCAELLTRSLFENAAVVFYFSKKLLGLYEYL